MVMGFTLCIPSVVVGVYLLEKEMGREWVVGWDVNLVKATIVQVMLI